MLSWLPELRPLRSVLLSDCWVSYLIVIAVGVLQVDALILCRWVGFKPAKREGQARVLRDPSYWQSVRLRPSLLLAPYVLWQAQPKESKRLCVVDLSNVLTTGPRRMLERLLDLQNRGSRVSSLSV